MLEQIPAAGVKAYVIWEPIRFGDRESAARRDQAIVPDPRAQHFWTPDLALARRFQVPIQLTTGPAWDVYLVYAADATWPETELPVPDVFMHQLAGRLPTDKLLNGPRLVRRVMELASQGREMGPASNASGR